jgi:hypothetical protein
VEGHQKGALGSGKTTHILFLERGVRFRRESEPPMGAHQQGGREGLGS